MSIAAAVELVPVSAVLDALPLSAILLNAEGYIELLNTEAEIMLGFSCAELQGHSIEAVLPLPPAAIASPILPVSASGAAAASSSSLVNARRRDGTTVPVNLRLAPWRFGAGNLALAILVDCTEQHKLQALNAEQMRFRAFIDELDECAITTIGPEGNVTSWNRGAIRLSGFSKEEIIGRHISIFYPPEQQVAGEPAYNLRMAKVQHGYETEGWRQRKDGSRFWATVVFNPLHDADDRPCGFGMLIRDSTAYYLLQARLQAAIESAPIAMIMINMKGEIVMTNVQAELTFGYGRVELLGQKIEMLVPLRSRGAHCEHRASFGAI